MMVIVCEEGGREVRVVLRVSNHHEGGRRQTNIAWCIGGAGQANRF